MFRSKTAAPSQQGTAAIESNNRRCHCTIPESAVDILHVDVRLSPPLIGLFDVRLNGVTIRRCRILRANNGLKLLPPSFAEWPESWNEEIRQGIEAQVATMLNVIREGCRG